MPKFLPRPAWAALLGCTLLLSCSPAAQPPVPLEVAIGDRQSEWGQVYYQSWLLEHNQRFLALARENTALAVRRYLALQKRMGYSYPDFYLIDRRRVAGCQFLTQLDQEALSFRVSLPDQGREGCFR